MLKESVSLKTFVFQKYCQHTQKNVMFNIHATSLLYTSAVDNEASQTESQTIKAILWGHNGNSSVQHYAVGLKCTEKKQNGCWHRTTFWTSILYFSKTHALHQCHYETGANTDLNICHTRILLLQSQHLKSPYFVKHRRLMILHDGKPLKSKPFHDTTWCSPKIDIYMACWFWEWRLCVNFENGSIMRMLFHKHLHIFDFSCYIILKLTISGSFNTFGTVDFLRHNMLATT